MKIFEFLKEDNGNFSNARLLAFFAVVSFIMDWQMHLWSHVEFNPSWTTVAFVLGVVGLKVQQKFTEIKNNVTTNTTVDAQ
jgi:hypothetical protein